jgi:hypothetical protein
MPTCALTPAVPGLVNQPEGGSIRRDDGTNSNNETDGKRTANQVFFSSFRYFSLFSHLSALPIEPLPNPSHIEARLIAP